MEHHEIKLIYVWVTHHLVILHLLCIGKKVDSWVGIDPLTGEKQLVLGVDAVDRKCPKPSRNTVYFGRTLYNIILYEAATDNKWNISFSEYATSSSSTIENYGNAQSCSVFCDVLSFLTLHSDSMLCDMLQMSLLKLPMWICMQKLCTLEFQGF